MPMSSSEPTCPVLQLVPLGRRSSTPKTAGLSARLSPSCIGTRTRRTPPPAAHSLSGVRPLIPVSR